MANPPRNVLFLEKPQYISFSLFGHISIDEWVNKSAGVLKENPGKRHQNFAAHELDVLEEQRAESKTRIATKWATQIFRDWLVENRHAPDFEMQPLPELCSLLRHFYAAVRNAKGDCYSNQSLISIGAGLNRQINNPPFSRAVNIMHDAVFAPANNVFVAILKKQRREGKDVSSRKEFISAQDLTLIKHCGILNCDEPISLQYKVIFDTQLHLARRSREGLRELPKNAFTFLVDEHNQEYATLTFNEQTKNHKEVNEKLRHQNRGCIYAQPDSAMCPVKSSKLYISKLPRECSCFYVQSKKLTVADAASASVWYFNKPLGKNTIGGLIKEISRKAALSRIYTNHCLHATAVQLLADNGFEAHQIVAVTGHKSKISVQHYWKASSEDRTVWSTVLANAGDSIRKDGSEKYVNGAQPRVEIEDSSSLGSQGAAQTTICKEFFPILSHTVTSQLSAMYNFY